MTALTPAELLAVADGGAALGLAGRALMLTSRAWPGSNIADCARLPLGQRDALILELRARTFGRAMPLEAVCSECGERLETVIDLEAIKAMSGEPKQTIEAELCGETRRLRLPTTEDLSAVSVLKPEEAEWALVERLTAVPADADREAFRSQAAQAITEADPLLDIEIDLACANCGKRESLPFDITACFWREIEIAAMRTAMEVHRLASAYGWSESDILAMSSYRRNLYLGMVPS